MKVYLEGSPDELNQFLYGVHDEFEKLEDALDEDDNSAEDCDEENKVTLDIAATLRAILNTLEANKAD